MLLKICSGYLPNNLEIQLFFEVYEFIICRVFCTAERRPKQVAIIPPTPRAGPVQQRVCKTDFNDFRSVGENVKKNQ